MAARWLGLARPNNNKARAKRCVQSLKDCKHAFGALAVLGIAAGMNFALYPEALARVVSGELPIATFVPEQSAADLQTPPPVALDEEEVRLLAATAWGEARSEGEHGMRAVAHVMVNRIGDRFGQTLREVVLAPKQFSVWNRGDPNRRLVQNPERYAAGGSAAETWEAAQRIAREVLSGQSVDPTGGALFYHTRAIRPSWSRYGHGRQIIGAHIFYADVPDRGTRGRVRVTPVTDRTLRPIDGPAARQGPRAGRVHGVIQRAPAGERRDVNAAATPTINGVPIARQR